MTESGKNREIQTVVLIGAGNVAWHLGHHLLKAGIQITQVFNRTAALGESLAAELNAHFTSRLDYLTEEADLYILAVSDDAIAKILDSGWFNGGQLVVHTAGSVSIDIFSRKAGNYGVLYPLQTFTRGKAIDFSRIPLFIEANNVGNLARINKMALKLSEKVYPVDSASRMYLHLAAVIASNFSNHLYALSEKLMTDSNLSFDMLKPLIQETVAKAMVMPPQKAQTGPAIRGNREVIEKHLALLEHHPEIRELYRMISKSIEELSKER